MPNSKNAVWSNKDPSERSKLLHRVADILESRLKEFAIAESQDQGKPLWLAQQIEVPRAVLNFRHFANTILCDKEMCINQPEDGILNYTSRSPCGVTAVIVPWNLPLYLLSFKLGPALAYGNTVVAKPSEFTSITAWKLCSVLKEAGIPDGVVNMVFGYGHKAGDALIRHSDVSLITFTGSDRAGLHIAEVAGAMAKKVSLEVNL
ncbi:2-aminomuconic semialdehyde dehydrogenase [Trichonephila clavata]|uniref:2-aminomuconic semialdehyde dehydrogenase n=1 Tax=Trichonephila clavata TaxID=2740835 RepID=A0A8X6KQ85_TRICU|nr:2-aminomuconic semialdehyde dehydrogenase [Trichonephila clavata]